MKQITLIKRADLVLFTNMPHIQVLSPNIHEETVISLLISICCDAYETILILALTPPLGTLNFHSVCANAVSSNL